MSYEPCEAIAELMNDARTLRLSNNQLAGLSGVAVANISRAMNHQRDLSYQEYRAMRFLLDDLKQIQERNSDLLIDWTDFKVTRSLIEKLHAEKNTPAHPLSDEEARLFAMFARGVSLENISFEARTSVPELLERVDDWIERIDKLSWSVAK